MIDYAEQIYMSRLDDRYRSTIPSIPVLNFPSHWGVKIIPPFLGATIRFRAVYKDKDVSVYLDHFNNLCSPLRGNRPYWEIYGHNGDETERFDIDDIDSMFNAINNYFNSK